VGRSGVWPQRSRRGRATEAGRAGRRRPRSSSTTGRALAAQMVGGYRAGARRRARGAVRRPRRATNSLVVTFLEELARHPGTDVGRRTGSDRRLDRVAPPTPCWCRPAWRTSTSVEIADQHEDLPWRRGRRGGSRFEPLLEQAGLPAVHRLGPTPTWRGMKPASTPPMKAPSRCCCGWIRPCRCRARLRGQRLLRDAARRTDRTRGRRAQHPRAPPGHRPPICGWESGAPHRSDAAGLSAEPTPAGHAGHAASQSPLTHNRAGPCRSRMSPEVMGLFLTDAADGHPRPFRPGHPPRRGRAQDGARRGPPVSRRRCS